MANATQQGADRSTTRNEPAGMLRGYRASVFASLVAVLWLAFVLPPALAGTPRPEVVYALMRAVLLLVAATLVLHHALAHLHPGRVVALGCASGQRLPRSSSGKRIAR